MTVVDAAASAAPNGGVSATSTVRFVGDPRAYWRLLIRGALLLAVTLGIYRFWLATDVRRFLWSNTEIAGETLEYTGTALELLIGFLIAVAFLIPLNVGFFVVALNLGPAGGLVSVLGFPILAFLGHFAVYRARRYRLTRTVYRGVRCHQSGSSWRYATCALFWWTLIMLTLGLAYPFAQASLERYKLRNTYYGNLGGRFDGSGLRLFLRGLSMWFLVVGPLAFAIVFSIATVDWDKVAAAAAAAGGGGDFINQLEAAFPALQTAVVTSIMALVVSAATAAFLFPIFQAMMMRWWLSGLRFGALTVRSQLSNGKIYGAYLSFLWYGFLFSLAAIAIATGAVIAYGFASETLKASDLTEIIGAVAGVGFYVLVMLGFSTIYQGTAKLALWRYSVESLELEGLAVFDQVKAEGLPSSAVGEGLADALNVGGF